LSPIGMEADGRRKWPDYLVFFEQLESVMRTALQGSGYAECWRGFNSHWHDDWRRTGDVLVWCLDRDRKRRVEGAGDGDRGKGMNGIWNRMKTVRSKTGAKKDNVVQHQRQPEPHHHEGKTLGGGKGPYGIGLGGDAKEQKEREKAHAVQGESTVERPFWKRREKVVKDVDDGFWKRVWPWTKAKSKKKTSWWEGGKWS